MLGMRRVGWIFGGHEARDPGFVLSGAEILMAAELQLEAAGGVEETPFVTVKVAPRREDGTVSVEAFQVSQQCMAMVAEQALELSPDPKVLKVNQTFTAIQEGKESPTVENNFFLCVVPIVQHTSEALVSDFPRLNRDVDDRFPSFDEMRRQLQKSGTSGWTFEDRLADFNLLLFLSDHLDVAADFPKICAAVVGKQPLEDGYKLILKSLAGMEGSY
jgi:nuclear protein localization family protein 4